MTAGIIGRFALATVAVLGFPAAAAPQDAIGLRGLVVDSATLAGLVDVSVLIGGAIHGETDATGSFELRGVSVGAHTLTLRLAGYQTKAFRFEVARGTRGVLDVGVVIMVTGTSPVTTFTGTVTAEVGLPIPRATVMLDGRARALTDDNGRFEVDDAGVGVHQLEVRRIGYLPLVTAIELASEGPIVDLDVVMDPLPVELAELVIEADGTVNRMARLRGFRRRREFGIGTFITRDQIETQAPMFVTDVFRRVPGVQVIPNTQFGGNQVTMNRGDCFPKTYIDGVELLGWDIDDFMHPDHIEAIEVYSSAMSAPAEFGGGTTCGAIAIWTR